jgi:putative RecB family exonuclease
MGEGSLVCPHPQVGTGRVDEIYSHSRLASFERCQRQFLYRYRLALPAEAESIEAFLGKRVHEVLERLYRARARGVVPTLAQVNGRFRQLFDDAYDGERVRIARIENDLGFYRELGEHCLANYYADHYPFDSDETVALEERVEFAVGDLDSGPVRLQGFVDRIARARDGALEIHDYKTGARVPSQAAIDEDRQLALYQLGFAPRVPAGAEVRLVWHYVRQGVKRESTRTAAQLEALRADTLARVDRIREERDFPASPGPLCRWCEYREGCSASPLRRTDVPSYERRPLVAAAAQAIAIGRRAPRRRRAYVHPGQLSLPLEARVAPAR